MEKITFHPEGEAPVDFYVLEQTTIAGVNYILVTDTAEDDGEAYILRDMSGIESEEAVYEMVSEDEELEAVGSVFEKLLDDVEFIE